VDKDDGTYDEWLARTQGGQGTSNYYKYVRLWEDRYAFYTRAVAPNRLSLSDHRHGQDCF